MDSHRKSVCVFYDRRSLCVFYLFLLNLSTRKTIIYITTSNIKLLKICLIMSGFKEYARFWLCASSWRHLPISIQSFVVITSLLSFVVDDDEHKWLHTLSSRIQARTDAAAGAPAVTRGSRRVEKTLTQSPRLWFPSYWFLSPASCRRNWYKLFTITSTAVAATPSCTWYTWVTLSKYSTRPSIS